jgi:uncharacterized membrane protein YedE/YeeE
MEFTIHNQVLSLAFLCAAIMGAVVNKTNFCTMGAVSDWVNMGDTGRLRSWLLAIAVAMAGLLILEGLGVVTLGSDTFPPYRTANFAWLRYLLGGVMFGIGMTLASGCGNKTLIRIGGGNIKSLFVLAITAAFAYLMLWTDFFNTAFMSWISPTVVNLAAYNIPSQEVSAIVGAVAGVQDASKLHLVLGGLIACALLVFVFKSADFRRSFDHMLGGLVVGLAVVAGWYITGGSMGQAWKEYAEFASDVPSRVAVQSYTFISPMGDTVRYLMEPTHLTLVNFGIVALTGVIVGSFAYAVIARRFRIEWFASFGDFLTHGIGAVLMGTGGVLAMGCTIGQGVTGVSTLAVGSMLTLVSIIFGSAATMKIQYYMLDEQNFFAAFRSTLADFRLLPARKAA